jgi:hypothetical protein
MLIAKNLSNPVHVSTDAIMRGAKDVLRNGRKALACAKDARSNYRDGKLPSGRTIADYHMYVRESMYQILKGGTGASSNDDGNDNAFGTSDNKKEDRDESNVAETEMPEDYFYWHYCLLSLGVHRCVSRAGDVSF